MKALGDEADLVAAPRLEAHVEVAAAGAPHRVDDPPDRPDDAALEQHVDEAEQADEQDAEQPEEEPSNRRDLRIEVVEAVAHDEVADRRERLAVRLAQVDLRGVVEHAPRRLALFGNRRRTDARHVTRRLGRPVVADVRGPPTGPVGGAQPRLPPDDHRIRAVRQAGCVVKRLDGDACRGEPAINRIDVRRLGRHREPLLGVVGDRAMVERRVTHIAVCEHGLLELEPVAVR